MGPDRLLNPRNLRPVQGLGSVFPCPGVHGGRFQGTVVKDMTVRPRVVFWSCGSPASGNGATSVLFRRAFPALASSILE